MVLSSSRLKQTKDSGLLLLAAICLASWSLLSPWASAAQLTNRSVVVSSGVPSATASDDFNFTYTSVGNVGSVVFEYCDNSPLFNAVCNAPTGLDVSSAAVTGQSGNVGFSVDGADTTTNKLVITRVSSAAAAVASSYNFSNVVNPSVSNYTVFVRISTYVTTDGSGPQTDFGAVAFATVEPLNIGASVPPFLRLCVGVSVTIDCSSTSGDRVNLGLITPASAASGESQFSAATNSISGYVVFIFGTTLTSGNNVIPALSSPTPSFPGNSQFGINLRANANPAVGQDPSGPGTASPTIDYNTPNLFKLGSGDSVTSDSLPSNYRLMSVSYVANVNSSQAAGVYNTTFTYLATADF
jgi:hypothetical protein